MAIKMEFNTTSLMRELKIITTNPSTPVHFTWVAKILIGKLSYSPIKVISIDFSQDFETKYADEIILTLAISGGMYAVDIYPFKDQIEILLIKNPINEISNNLNTEAGVQTEKYVATLIDIGNPVIEGNAKFTPTKDALNLTTILEVQFQLVNKALQQIRLINVGGIYRKVLAADVVKTILTNEIKKLKIDGNRTPIGVDMVPNFNTKVRDHVIIPQGTRLVDVPEYVHVKCGGIYSSGFGYYLQNDYWYIYPCYDITRVSKATNVLTIINVPPHMYPSIERTYRVNGKSIVILATGDIKYRDDSEAQQLNAGNGVRFSSADNFTTKFETTSNNKTTISRGLNNTEIIATTRVDKINNAPISSNKINANFYLEYSKLARRNGANISLVWENSLPSIITPGAMVRIMYINNNSVNIINGVILKAHHYVSMKEKGVVSTRYVTRTALFIFCNIVKTAA